MPDPQHLLDQIDRLDQEATKGPWYSENEDYKEHYEGTAVYNVFHNGETPDRDLMAEAYYGNAEFIAEARTLLPQLAQALRAVMELHKPVELYPAVTPGVIYCASCWDGVIDEAYEYPCPTAQIMTDQIEGDDA